MKNCINLTTSALVVLLLSLTSSDLLAEDMNESERCMELVLYWEAKTEGAEGMQAVGHVVLNRVKHDEFPSTICEVMQHGGETPPCQFSFWCDGKSDRPDQQSETWQLSQSVSRQLISNPSGDPTSGALFFHIRDIEIPWSIERERTAAIGEHIFYR